jgi:hypothetical protein
MNFFFDYHFEKRGQQGLSAAPESFDDSTLSSNPWYLHHQPLGLADPLRAFEEGLPGLCLGFCECMGLPAWRTICFLLQQTLSDGFSQLQFQAV